MSFRPLWSEASSPERPPLKVGDERTDRRGVRWRLVLMRFDGVIGEWRWRWKAIDAPWSETSPASERTGP